MTLLLKRREVAAAVERRDPYDVSVFIDLAPKEEDARKAFAKAKTAEREYSARLRNLAKHIGHLVQAFDPNSWQSAVFVQAMLKRYAATIEPWARAIAWRMLTEVSARDKAAWGKMSTAMGAELKRMIEGAPIGRRMQELLAEQVHLITSLPLDAAQRVHDLTLQGITEGARAPEIAAEILRTGEVTTSRAMLIARTEVSRTASVLTQVRAEHVGSTGYVWRTVGDADVRPDHKRLNGTFFTWNDPPIADQRAGVRAHPGAIYNCRCYPEVIVPQF
jgi:SPP1 gp7 family putative phage head morphogenesis protein